MAQLIWDEAGKHFFETGISKGVLYGKDGQGFVWNGLTSIEESVDTEVQPVYFDGTKFNDIVTIGDFSATLKAFTYPNEFLEFEGIQEDQDGFFITSQIPSKFGLSYQTRVGNEFQGTNYGYKIHLLYNLTAVPSQKTYATLASEVEPEEFEWTITGIPEDIENYRATAHIIIDSRRIDPWLLEDIEAIIYGDEDNDAYLPPLKGFATFIQKWDRLIITDNGDGTWTADSVREGIIIMVDDTTFQIISDTAVYLDPDTYEISSSDKNEEDIWLP